MSGVGITPVVHPISDEIRRQVKQLLERRYPEHRMIIYLGFEEYATLLKESDTPVLWGLSFNGSGSQEWNKMPVFRTERTGVHVYAEL